MSYIVFARKYRPQTFDDIIGQSHITTTLKNAITQGRVAHAYIFAGPRGVGKTTTARIFAKALNCEKGPTAKPCNNCPSCKEIALGSSLDILEIDGASNRGIDEIRALRENVKFAPSKGNFKIYIIDEVHMLTAEAFNALLKTLEEPPAHVKFIFATTQGHKVPKTILSRCQRFDFRRISSGDIFGSLKKIVKNEKLDVKDGALELIAKNSDGGMRDAQVTLDQITSFTKGEITAGDVSKLLGIVEDEILFGLSLAINKKDAPGALKIIDRIINEGKDANQVVTTLIEHFRNISIAKISKDLGSLIDAGEERIKDYRNAAEGFTLEEILYVIYTLSNTIDFIRKSNIARIPLEAAMVKLTMRGSVMAIDDIVKRLDSAGASLPEIESSAPAQQVEQTRGNTATPPKEDRKEAKASAATPSDHPAHEALGGAGKPQTANYNAKAQTAVLSSGLEGIVGSWQNIINYIMPKKISIASYLQEGYPTDMSGNVLTIGFPKSLQFHKEVVESTDNKRLIEEAIKSVAGKEIRVNFTLTEYVNGRKRNGIIISEDDIEELGGEDIDHDQIDPIVKTALDVFGGDVTGRDASRRRAR